MKTSDPSLKKNKRTRRKQKQFKKFTYCGNQKKMMMAKKKEIIVKTQNKTGKKLRKIEEATLTTTINYTRTHTHR